MNGDADMNGRDRIWTSIALVAMLAGCGFAGIGFLYGEGLCVAVPQLDSAIFYQYARAIAEGHPYRFIPGDPFSTGSTSHLYPVVLAAFYAVGFKGGALASAGLLLNLALWLGSLRLCVAIARRILPEENAVMLAAALCVLNGQFAMGFFLQSDMGLFAFLTLGALAAALSGRWRFFALSLGLAAWTRPEGAILAGCFLAAAFAPRAWFPADASRRALIAGALTGLACFAGSLILNKALTGQFQFQSIAGKSIFLRNGLMGGVNLALKNTMQIVSEGVFNVAPGARAFYAMPVIGGLLGIAGLALRGWRGAATARAETGWWMAVTATLALSALSGWCGIQHDKYWVWFTPVWSIVMVAGLWRAPLLERSAALRRGLAAALLFCAAAGMAFFLNNFAHQNSRAESNLRFVRSLDQRIPEGAPVGLMGASGLAYFLPSHPVVNISGICSPRYLLGGDTIQAHELLRHRPELRFDYWLIRPSVSESALGRAIGEQLLAPPPVRGGTDAFALHRADWDGIDGALAPLAVAPAGERVDSLDIGFSEDEARCQYEIFHRLPGMLDECNMAEGPLAGHPVGDLGRLVIGEESFTVNAQPGKPLRIVLRGALLAAFPVIDADLERRTQAFEFGSPLRLNVWMGDREVGVWTIEAGEGPLFESVFEIPAKFIDSDRPRITVGGDHISLGWWFYQGRTQLSPPPAAAKGEGLKVKSAY